MECADGQHIYVKYENVVCWWFVNAGTISAWRMVLVTSPHVRMILSAKHSSFRGNCNGIEIWYDHYCGLQSNHPRSIYSSPHFYWGQSSAPCVQVEHGRAEHGSLTGACSSGRLKQFWKSMLFQSQRRQKSQYVVTLYSVANVGLFHWVQWDTKRSRVRRDPYVSLIYLKFNSWIELWHLKI